VVSGSLPKAGIGHANIQDWAKNLNRKDPKDLEERTSLRLNLRGLCGLRGSLTFFDLPDLSVQRPPSNPALVGNIEGVPEPAIRGLWLGQV
jgi:hypothetical protein